VREWLAARYGTVKHEEPKDSGEHGADSNQIGGLCSGSGIRGNCSGKIARPAMTRNKEL